MNCESFIPLINYYRKRGCEDCLALPGLDWLEGNTCLAGGLSWARRFHDCSILGTNDMVSTLSCLTALSYAVDDILTILDLIDPFKAPPLLNAALLG